MKVLSTTLNATQAAPEVIVARPHVPDDLRARLATLTSELEAIAPEATADALEGIPRIDAALLRRRIIGLRDLLGRVRVIDAPGVAMLGSRILVHHADGSPDAFELVAPDDVDATAGRISVESPLGRAILGRVSGERAHYDSPTGRRVIQIASVR